MQGKYLFVLFISAVKSSRFLRNKRFFHLFEIFLALLLKNICCVLYLKIHITMGEST